LSGVIWITGLAGAGKSSLAAEVTVQLRDQGRVVLLLDGDAVRAALGDTNFDRGARRAAAYRLSGLAQLAARQNLTAVVATLSLFHEVHAFNRQLGCAYLEVLLQCSEQQLAERSSLYAQDDGSLIVGRGIMPEYPQAPHLILHNNDGRDRLPALARQVVDRWIGHVGIR
jgi:cytidine diphosphoramidate kinase